MAAWFRQGTGFDRYLLGQGNGPGKFGRTLQRLLRLSALIAVSSACGDGDNPPPAARQPSSSPRAVSAYAVKGYLVKGDRRLRVDFGPSSYWSRNDETSPAESSNQIEAKALTPPPQQAQSATKCDGAGGTNNCSPLDLNVQGTAEGQLFDGETLLLALTGSCVDQIPITAPFSGHEAQKYTSVLTKWPGFELSLEAAFAHPGVQSYIDALPHVWDKRPGFPSWFVFPHADPAQVGCDEILARQEVLLCAANRLVEIADAVTTTNVGFDNDSHWEFPVQDIKDKFILRDLALRTLGNLGLLETKLPASPSVNHGEIFAGLDTCSDIYVRAAKATDSEFSSFAYATFNLGGWLELPQVGNLARAHELMAQRANYKTNIFRAAGRMARELLDESIQADVAGAEKRRAEAGDPVHGLELMWGADPDAADSSFNTLRHALAILSGRLDVINPSNGMRACDSPLQGNSNPDPYGLLDKLGSGRSARWHDRPPQTPGQSLALSLVTQTGLLLPAVSSASDADIQAVVEEQLLRNAAASRGVPVQLFEASSGGDALRKVLAQVSVADLRFGLDRNLDAYRLLADEQENVTSFGGFGLTLEEDANVGPTVLALQGSVLKGGIPRSDIQIDKMGLAGRPQVIGQCGNKAFGSTDVAAQLNAQAPLQNVFTLGQSFGHHLSQIAAGFNSVTDLAGAAATIKNAEAGAAELRTWAGPGTLFSVDDSTGLRFSVFGVRPSDIGAKDVDGMASRLALVRMREADVRPWRAECVAGIRKSCPPDMSSFETAFETTATPIPPYDPDGTVTVNGHDYRKIDLAGYVGPYLTLTVEVAHYTTSAHDSYALVQRPLGDKPGRVLATILTGSNVHGGDGPGPAGGYVRIEAISDYQRTLLNQVFGTGNPARHGSTCGDVTSTAIPDNYCINGMQRDMFVPLSNELTSDGGQQEDSWKHYLALAETAAAHVDELGTQLIQAGEARELRREGAQESLGSVCGTFASVDSLAVNNGDIQTDQADAALGACINPPRTDLVFLTGDPFDSTATTTAAKTAVDDKIRTAYCAERADGKSAPKFCTDKNKASIDPNKRYITHRALGLKTYVDPAPSSTCKNILDLAAKVTNAGGLGSSGSSVGAALSKIASEPWVTHASLFAGFGAIRLTVKASTDLHGEILWEGRRYDKLILGPGALFDADDVAAKEVFPACVDLHLECTGTAELMRKVFNPANEVLKHTEVRHRIEAALFHLGAVVGVIPAETFSVQVPVYNATPGTDTNPSDPNRFTEAPAIYGDATLNTNGSGADTYYTLAIEPSNPIRDAQESSALGHTRDAPDSYWRARNAEDTPVLPGSAPPIQSPAWRKKLYEDANGATKGTYSVIEGKNPVLMFDDLIQGSKDVISRADNIQQWIREFGTDMSGKCRAWPAPGNLALGLYTFSDKFPPNHWSTGANADRVTESLQRNVCASAVNPVFYEDVQSRDLHIRAVAWHAVGGTKAFKDIIEDISDPNDAMHKQGAAFFEPFSRCAVGVDPARFPESCIRWASYTEQNAILRAAANSFPDPDYVPKGNMNGNEGNFRSALENRLQPSVCSPGARAELFINRYPNDSCEVAQAVVQGLALACVMGDEPVALTVGDPPPVIQGPESLPLYEAWLSLVELQLGEGLNQGYFTDFPDAVLDRNSGAQGFSSSLGGGRTGHLDAGAG